MACMAAGTGANRGGTAAAAAASPLVASASTPSSQSATRPVAVFKNPLDKYGSPPPASKRQKIGHTENGSGSGSGSGSENNTAIKTSPTMARSQLTPAGSGLRTGFWGGSSPMTPTQRVAQKPMAPRQRPVPSGFKQSYENNQIILVLDDDDDDDDNGGGDIPSSVRSSAPPPTQAPNPATAWLNASSTPITTQHGVAQPPGMNAARREANSSLPDGHSLSSTALTPSLSYSLYNSSQIPAASPGATAAVLPPSYPSHPSHPSLPQTSTVQPTQPTQTQQTQHTLPATLSTSKDQRYTRFVNLARRPYLQSRYREYISDNYQDIQKLLGRARGSPVIHVDFGPDEVQHVLDAVRSVIVPAAAMLEVPKHKNTSPEKEIKNLLKKRGTDFLLLVVNSVDLTCLPGRTAIDVLSFIADVRASKHRARVPTALSLCRHDRSSHYSHQERTSRTTKLSTLLFGREMVGQRILSGRMRQPVNFANEIRKLREDSLTACNEWTNCAGDVTTISWTSEDSFVCGTTTHMDDRNHQYNRQGNLALASIKSGQLMAYPDHRIVRRPQTRPGNPASHSHDDPWLYTSVVSSDFASVLNLAFTSSFDETVKAWRVESDGKMLPMGTWRHKGKVNFVVASTHEMGLVATAADVSEKSVRIYRFFNSQEHSRITYKVLPCPRIFDAAGRALIPDKWAYLPAAVRWGLSRDTNHLLLVGFSPRGLGLTADDEDIPLDRRDTGELRLWDGRDGSAWQVNGGRRNVFEVAWHPTQACFIAATSPKTHNVDENIRARIRTQVSVYRPANTTDNGGRVYAEVQTLDCFAEDINELALLPNSIGFIYVAAGATNGKTYVWDTSQGDSPVHVLEHGKCIEELAGERISNEDTGVKFVAWGQTPDRLYTGSSDGIVKVWNVRTHSNSSATPFVRNLLQCPGPVSFGAFSPNKSKLAIGDATGRVTVLAVDDNLNKNDEEADFLSDTDDEADVQDSSKPISNTRIAGPAAGLHHRRHPKTFKQHPPEIIRHPTPPPPPPPPPPPQAPTVPPPPSSVLLTQPQGNASENDDDDGCSPAKELLASGQLIIVPDRTVGAVKGPNYAQTNLYCRDFHLDRQPHQPLLAEYERAQQENKPSARSAPSRQRPFNTRPVDSFPTERLFVLHQLNKQKDLTVRDLEASTVRELSQQDRGALQQLIDAGEGIDEPYEFGYEYEELPDDL
ncbi:wd repeat-containing protein [Ophiostoma piceae UAMH 11346]|uniref:Wd repeat-containing protein n=1 Tax=Ophiostoma piceae (strain UAMH 11346) TaxID=1262450 RepID=S3D5V9_OPHP1|nr:wd repeat-containing protein [Ophiostoma piceae UAMH 11346]